MNIPKIRLARNIRAGNVWFVNEVNWDLISDPKAVYVRGEADAEREVRQFSIDTGIILDPVIHIERNAEIHGWKVVSLTWNVLDDASVIYEDPQGILLRARTLDAYTGKVENPPVGEGRLTHSAALLRGALRQKLQVWKML